jgi:hypothetical protein
MNNISRKLDKRVLSNISSNIFMRVENEAWEIIQPEFKKQIWKTLRAYLLQSSAKILLCYQTLIFENQCFITGPTN